jgi:hypothetical protein
VADELRVAEVERRAVGQELTRAFLRTVGERDDDDEPSHR